MMICETSSQTTAAVPAAPSVPIGFHNTGHFSSFLMAHHQITNDRRASSMPSGPYAYALAGGQLPFLDCHGGGGGEDGPLMHGFDPANLVHAAGGSTTEPEMDAYDCESEVEVVEAAEEQPKSSGPSRSGSKRSRAAEVHNLSEKRRRSRINEKMKALQKLIPNSNKTDKASMLDEAIDYLKQLQLQVQMLSMRNGLSLHPAFVPGAMPPLQVSQICLPFASDNAPLMHPGMGQILSGDSSNSSIMNLPSQQCMPSHPSLIPTVSNINDLVASFGMDTSQTPHGLMSLPVTAEGAFSEVTAANRHLNPIHSSRTGVGMNCLDGSALYFDGQTQMPHSRHLETSSEDEHPSGR